MKLTLLELGTCEIFDFTGAKNSIAKLGYAGIVLGTPE
jgi:hypothetical protein